MKKRGYIRLLYKHLNLVDGIRFLENHIPKIEKELNKIKEDLKTMKGNVKTEPYCYLNRFYEVVFPDGKKMVFKVKGVQGKGVRTNPDLRVCGDDGFLETGYEYSGRITLDVIRKAKEISQEEFEEFLRFTYDTGW